ncbi:MAG: hypothetical protein KY449_09180, partial [Proteobacteria bacterium]|nr:hypothetical protein [Pseudomonadota bacterium]
GATVAGPAGSCVAGTLDVGLVNVPGGQQRVCQLSGTITGALQLPSTAGVVYSLSGRVSVGADVGGDGARPDGASAQLVVAPGVRIFGSSGADFLVVQRGSTISAIGSVSSPIVFTSRQDIEGTDTPQSIGQFGGLVLLGRAPINSCPAATPGGTVNCEAQVEGANAFYGGATANDSSGSLIYVQVKYAGFEVAPNNELNGITLAGVGSGTRVENIQVHNGSDDGVELFGGTVNLRNVAVTGADDDSIDWDTGYAGGIQFLLVVQRPEGGDHALELSSGASNNDREPRSRGTIANFTLVTRNNAGAQAWVLNQGTDGNFVNGVVTGKPVCLDIDNNATVAAAPTFNSLFFSCATAFRDLPDGTDTVTAAQIAGLFNAGANNAFNGVNSLQNLFINGNNESGRPASDAARISGNPFFQSVNFIGAVPDAADARFRGWTCNLYAGGPTC